MKMHLRIPSYDEVASSNLKPPPELQPVEASSLSAILELASSPPLRRPPPDASWERHKSLLLWIVRVPGSKDVILTTFYPEKRATAADIGRSLYYLHFSKDEPDAATLIRRHPVEGSQENVAFVKAGGEAAEVEMLGTGYGKFLERSGGRRKTVPGQETEEDSVMGNWKQRMHIEGMGMWDRIVRHRRKKSKEGSGGEPGEKKKKKRGFVFDGPWPGGYCEFQGEMGGKFLKCKYYADDEEKSTLLSVIECKNFGIVGGHAQLKPSEDAGEGSGRSERGKMGMFVIHAPGLEMLDLLVVANMVAFLRKWDEWGKERKAGGGW